MRILRKGVSIDMRTPQQYAMEYTCFNIAPLQHLLNWGIKYQLKEVILLRLNYLLFGKLVSFRFSPKPPNLDKKSGPSK